MTDLNTRAKKVVDIATSDKCKMCRGTGKRLSLKVEPDKDYISSETFLTGEVETTCKYCGGTGVESGD